MEYLEKFFKKSGWMSIIEAVVIAILGLILILNPEGTVKAISIILGLIFIVAGLIKIAQYFMAKGKYDLYNHELIYGLMAIVIGIVTMVYSNTIGSIFRIIIGVWIIYSSLMRLSLAFKLKNLKSNAWGYSLILALIMLVCGLYVTINSGAVMVIIGAMMITYAVIDIIEDVIFMKNVKKIF